MNADKFQKFFNNAPLVHIKGRTHLVEIKHLDPTLTAMYDYIYSACSTVRRIHETTENGDILVFLTGEDEIEQACALLSKEIAIKGL